MLELVTAVGGTIKPEFGCHLCLLKDGVFCVSYQLGHPDVVRYQQQWLEAAAQVRRVVKRK